MTEPELWIAANADRSTTIKLSGEISSANLAAVRRALDCTAGPAPLIVDLCDVTFVDAAGVALLFDVARDCGLEIILGPACAVYSVIQVSGLDQVATLR